MILRACIAVPTYDNPNTIVDIIRQCVERTPFPIIVVDDGSQISVSELIAQRRLLFDTTRVHVIRHDANRGKGAALQSAFRHALSKGYTHVVSIDADGQHLVKDIDRMVKAALENPWSLILGRRQPKNGSMPSISEFGRDCSNFWVAFETDVNIRDSQTGFRIYPLFHLQNLKFWTKRYDFEIEVLIRLIWNNVEVIEVDIDVVYPPEGSRVTHFRKFWDNARITFLNVLFVFISLLRKPQSRLRAAVACALGVFIGCLPIYGLHTLIAGGTALLFRLNFIYLFFGSQISIPPLAPFLVLGGITTAKTLNLSLWLGFFVFAATMALSTFCLVFLILGRKYATKKEQTWSGKNRGGVLGNWVLKTAVRYGGRPLAYLLARLVIPYFYFFAPRARRAANQYWQILRPNQTYVLRQYRIFQQLFCFAQILIDRLYQQCHKHSVFKVQANGFENILGPVKAKEGLILMTAHVGAWDLAIATLEKEHHVVDFLPVKYEAQGLTFDKVLDALAPKDASGLSDRTNRVLPAQSQAIFRIRELLQKGHAIGLMGDRPLSQHYELVPFLNRLAPFDTTAFRIASLCRVPFLFTFGFKGKGNHYHFYAFPARKRNEASHELQSLYAFHQASEYAKNLEALLGQYPTQWFNFYSFWSSIPERPTGELTTPQKNYLLEQVSKPVPAAPALEPVRKTIGAAQYQM